MRREEGDDGAADVGPQDTHGVLHLLSPAEYGKLCGMEHEYRQSAAQGSPAFLYFASPFCFLLHQLPPIPRSFP